MKGSETQMHEKLTYDTVLASFGRVSCGDCSPQRDCMQFAML